MSNLLFVGLLGVVLLILLGWGFKHLPGERWQMLAVVPLKKREDNHWLGVNVTYYGFFIATSQLIALGLLLVLLGAMHVSLPAVIPVILLLLAFCLPAARLIAMLVEKKRHTFTIGGASFVGILIAPWLISATAGVLQPYNYYLPMLPVLAALSIAYTLGEGLGRLGCISFGCCYGKPLKDCNTLLKFLFSRVNVVFHGQTKKVAYEARLCGEKLIPIQALTCVIYTLGALFGSYLYLNGHFTGALVFTMVLTQLWRILSETMRADFRGFGSISVYQKMGIVAVFYIIALVSLTGTEIFAAADIISGLKTLWNPAAIIGLQLLWLVFFITFGRSTVTSATVSFALIEEHI